MQALRVNTATEWEGGKREGEGLGGKRRGRRTGRGERGRERVELVGVNPEIVCRQYPLNAVSEISMTIRKP